MILSIVISAVLLGMVVSCCVRIWMPTETFDWVMFCLMVLCGFFAVFRIASLAKQLENKEE